MKKLIMTKGLPASGKTTFAKAALEEHPGACKRVNKDDLRAMLDGGKWSRDNEKFVLAVRDQIIGAALDAGKHVICDDTNLAPKHRERLEQLAKQHGAALEVEDFTHVSVEECIARDRKRPNYVGEKTIRSMHEQFLEPAPPIVEYDPKLPDCIIVDIDGTIAQMNGRGPYEWKRVGEDKPRREVIDAVVAHRSYWPVVLIIFSGRDECCREETKQWLAKTDLVGWFLYMRPEGDMRPDTVIKREMHDAHIAGKYNVKAIFDDRPQVIRLWQSLGFGDRIFNVGDGREF